MSHSEPVRPTVLIVDDDPAIRRLFREILAHDYSIAEASRGDEALARAVELHPYVVLLDIQLPDINGYHVCRQLKAAANVLPQVIMVSAESAEIEQIKAFDCGADDYLVKPVDPCDLRSRVQLHLRLRDSKQNTAHLQRQIDCYHAALRQTTAERAKQIVAVQDAAVFTLAKVAEARDNETGAHLLRLREYAQLLVEELSAGGPYASRIDDAFKSDLYRSSPLHDIGKVGIPDEILLKPGRLTPDEMEIMRRHAVNGANILNEAVMQLKGGGFLAMAAVIARFHHERWDGAGYPAGLVGEEIPLPARIVAVADVYDALTSERPYKPAWTPERARRAIEEGSGTQFDPVIVEAFQCRFDGFLSVARLFADRTPVATGAMAFADSAGSQLDGAQNLEVLLKPYLHLSERRTSSTLACAVD
jgi:putative two-component system response regulator